MRYHHYSWNTFDDVIADLKKITLMSREDIISFVQSSVISYSELREFYLKFGRLPSNTECIAIYNGLINMVKL